MSKFRKFMAFAMLVLTAFGGFLLTQHSAQKLHHPTNIAQVVKGDGSAQHMLTVIPVKNNGSQLTSYNPTAFIFHKDVVPLSANGSARVDVLDLTPDLTIGAKGFTGNVHMVYTKIFSNPAPATEATLELVNADGTRCVASVPVDLSTEPGEVNLNFEQQSCPVVEGAKHLDVVITGATAPFNGNVTLSEVITF